MLSFMLGFSCLSLSLAFSLFLQVLLPQISKPMALLPFDVNFFYRTMQGGVLCAEVKCCYCMALKYHFKWKTLRKYGEFVRAIHTVTFTCDLLTIVNYGMLVVFAQGHVLSRLWPHGNCSGSLRHFGYQAVSININSPMFQCMWTSFTTQWYECRLFKQHIANEHN